MALTDLLNQAAEIRDADTEQENTALRVGTMLVNIIQQLGLNVTAAEVGTAIANALSTYFSNGKLKDAALPSSAATDTEVASAIASALEDYVESDALSEYLTGVAHLNSGKTTLKWTQSPIVLLESMGSTYDNVDGGSYDYTPQTGDLYYSDLGGHNWIMEKLAQGSSGEAVRMGVLYINKHTGRMYTWNGTSFGELNMSNVQINVINSTTSTLASEALSAAQGYVLRRELERLLAALSNSAFSTARPTFNWSAPVTYNISQALTHCTSSHSGNTIDGSSAATITLTPDSAYILKTSNVAVSMVGGGSVSVSRNDQTGVVTVSIPTITGAITINATATVPLSYSITRNLSHCTSSNSAASVTEGSGFSTMLSAESGYTLNGVTPTITMGGNAVAGAWDSSTGTITIAEVTGDIVISATAVESVNPSITYNLTSVTKSSGPTEVEEGDSLTAVLSAPSDFAGKHPAYNSPVGFSSGDVLVMMGGTYVQNAVSQSSMGADATVSIASVTDDVTITNIIWATGTINGTTGAINTSSRSLYNTTKIALPEGCAELLIRHNYASLNNYGIAFYDESGTYLSGVNYASVISQSTLSETVTVPTGAASFICSLYCWNHTGGAAADMYIKDNTNNKYIWKGDNVQ